MMNFAVNYIGPAIMIWLGSCMTGIAILVAIRDPVFWLLVPPAAAATVAWALSIG
jgi:hypothetical protein